MHIGEARFTVCVHSQTPVLRDQAMVGRHVSVVLRQGRLNESATIVEHRTKPPRSAAVAPVHATVLSVHATVAPVRATVAPVRATVPPVLATEAPRTATEARRPATVVPGVATEAGRPATEAWGSAPLARVNAEGG